MEAVQVQLVGLNGFESLVTMQVAEDRALLVLQASDLEAYGIAAEDGPSRLVGDTVRHRACFLRRIELDGPGTRVYHADMRIRSKLARALSEEPAALTHAAGRGWVLTWALGPSSV